MNAELYTIYRTEYLHPHFPIGMLVASVAVLAFGLFVLRRMILFNHFSDYINGKLPQRDQKWFLSRLLVIPFGILLLVGTLLANHRALSSAGALTNELAASTIQVAQGTVKVLHQQPSTGHDSGDIVQVGQHKFEIDFYMDTAFYRQTISHGGVLQEGRRVKVYFIPDASGWFGDGKIIRILEEK